MKIIFCDDDPKIIAQLKALVGDFFKEAKIEPVEMLSFSSGDELIDSGESADIAFLDVEMPGRSGILAGRTLMERNPGTKVFMVTAFPDYLDEAMRFHVFRYLSKPIDPQRLYKNLRDAVFQYKMEIVELPVELKDEVVIVKAQDIVYAESAGRRARLVMPDRTLETLKGFEHWENTLTLPCFYPCYRGVIVNMRFIHTFNKERITLRYSGKEDSVYLARRKYTAFKTTFMLFMETTR